TFDLPSDVVTLLRVVPVIPMYVGDSVRVFWNAFNAATLPVFTNPTLSLSDTAAVTLSSSDRIVARTTGFSWVRAAVNGALDSAPVAVVPHGRFGALVSGAWNESDMNGVLPTYVFVPTSAFSDPRFSASHDTLAYTNGAHIQLRLPN